MQDVQVLSDGKRIPIAGKGTLTDGLQQLQNLSTLLIQFLKINRNLVIFVVVVIPARLLNALIRCKFESRPNSGHIERDILSGMSYLSISAFS